MKENKNNFGFNRYASPVCYGKPNNKSDEFSLCVDCEIKVKCEREERKQNVRCK